MSTSVSSKKSRKDFGFSSSVAASLNVQKEEPVIEEPAVIEENPAVIEPAPIDNTTAEQGSVTEVTEPETVDEHKETPKKSRGQSKKDDDIDKILSLSRNTHGVQKSIYLDEDIYLYIKDKCDKNKAKFSVVLNLMLRKYIEEQK